MKEWQTIPNTNIVTVEVRAISHVLIAARACALSILESGCVWYSGARHFTPALNVMNRNQERVRIKVATYITNRIDGQAAVLCTDDEKITWDDIKAEAAKNIRSKVEVTPYDSQDEISEAQRKWLHCKNGPIRELMRGGWSFRDAKEHVKVEYGRQWFVVELRHDNFKRIDGVFRWECKKALCRKLIHPMDIFATQDGRRLCPFCEGIVKPIAIKSIMDVSVKKTNLWFDEIFAHFPKNENGKPRVEQPDPKWKIKEKKENT